jgi:hypothetical protein
MPHTGYGYSYCSVQLHGMHALIASVAKNALQLGICSAVTFIDPPKRTKAINVMTAVMMRIVHNACLTICEWVSQRTRSTDGGQTALVSFRICPNPLVVAKKLVSML